MPLFENIKNENLQKSIYAEHPWGPEELKRKVRILTIADMQLLRMHFPMPDALKHYKAMVNILFQIQKSNIQSILMGEIVCSLYSIF